MPGIENPSRNEHWSIRAGDAPIAHLDIAADLQRERIFEISFSMSVRPHANGRQPWHELRVYANGELQWSRRIATQHAAPFDGLDYRFRRSVGVGETLRLMAHSDCREAQRLQLMIEADEC